MTKKDRVERHFRGRPEWQKEIISLAPEYFISDVDISGHIRDKADKSTAEGPHLLMAFGFEHGPGWAGILRAFIKFCKMEEENDATLKGHIKMDQIKEKFGGLRIYCSGNMAIQDAATFAEFVSYETCEECGNPGKPNEDGWIKTLCDKCRVVW